MNRIMLAGNVLDKNGDGIVLETNEISFDGNDTYTHVHPVTMTAKDLKAVKKSSQIKVMGKFGKDKDGRGRLEALTVDPNYKGDDLNFGEVVGTAHRSFQFFEAKGDKRAFGNVLVRLDDGMILRGVLFAPTCHRFNGPCTTGSTVQVLGRIQHRAYIDREGDEQVMIEIVGNDDFSNVLESVELINPFEETQAEAI